MSLTSYTRDGLVFDVTDSAVATPTDGEHTDPVVLLHGFPADRHCWDEVGAHLQAAGLRTLAPDQRGYSPGARPTDPYPQAYAVDELVLDVLALADAAGTERFHLVGHDWGGAVAWAVAGAYPDRVASLTVLSTPHPAALTPKRRDSWQTWHSMYVLAFQPPWVPELVMRHQLAPWLIRSGLPRPVADRYAARMREPGALTAALGWYRALRLGGGTAHRVPVPTTLVWGRHDDFLGRTAAELTREFTTGVYELVELDQGHWLPEVDAAECAEHIRRRIESVA